MNEPKPPPAVSAPEATPIEEDANAPPLAQGPPSPELEHIGVYRVESRLGRGGMGEVFLGYDERLDRHVAIKRIRHGSRINSRQRERFRREARAVARLSHPSIVQVFDLVEGESGDCIVLEFIEGRTVREMLGDGQEGPLEPRLAVRLTREIAEGLAAAHDAGMVHRDLKAENVIVTAGGHAKILDFGLAKPIFHDVTAESLTEHGTVLGTSHAMSPEQAGGNEVDGRSDLFSLGVLLYEMLTGISPFRGENPLDTLRRVLTHEPPPLRVIRPDLPPALDALVRRLLSKDREERPQTAGEVAQALEEIVQALPGRSTWQSPTGGPDAGSLGDLPTGGSTLFDAAPSRSAARSPAAVSPAVSPGLGDTARPHRWRWAPAALAALVAIIAMTVYLVRLRPGPPMRIAVLRPTVAADADAANHDLQLVRSGVLVTVLGGLAARQGVAPVEISEPRRDAEPPVETARAAAAAEVLSAAVEAVRGAGAMARVSLRRIRGSDGTILATRTFDVLTDPREMRSLADAVELNLAQLYPDHPRREGTPELEVRDEDYAAFLDVKRRLLSGNTPLPPELQQLERIARSSPRFLESHLLGASLARSLFQSTLDRGYLERQIELVRQAERLAPEDPRVAIEQFRLALARDRDDEAEAILGRIGRLLPGDPRYLELSAELNESRGQMDEAIADMNAAVEHAPSWRYLFRLANLEFQGGRIAAARRRFEELLARDPRNLWGLEGLANLELLAGDPARAERLYLRLIQITPQRSYFTNLGQARFLFRRYAQAEAAYRKALELAPDHFSARFNLAEALLALGRREEALALFRQVLAQVQAHEAVGRLDANDAMLKAQCLAYLGRSREAVVLTQSTLQESPENAEVLYLASLVYALAGERTSALVNAELALAKGCHPRWFTIPAFDALRGNPDFQSLLTQAGASNG